MNIFLISTIALSLTRLALFVFLHLKYREFSILKNTVSDYGTGKSRQLYSTMAVLSFIAYIALFLFLVGAPNQQWSTAVLGIAILGSIAILFFPTDRTGSKPARTGKIHLLLAVVNFTALFVFMTNAHTQNIASSGVLNTITWVVRITFYTFLISLVLPKLRRQYIGLTERLFLAATPVWFIAFAWLMLS